MKMEKGKRRDVYLQTENSFGVCPLSTHCGVNKKGIKSKKYLHFSGFQPPYF